MIFFQGGSDIVEEGKQGKPASQDGEGEKAAAGAWKRIWAALRSLIDPSQARDGLDGRQEMREHNLYRGVNT